MILSWGVVHRMSFKDEMLNRAQQRILSKAKKEGNYLVSRDNYHEPTTTVYAIGGECIGWYKLQTDKIELTYKVYTINKELIATVSNAKAAKKTLIEYYEENTK